MKKCLSIISGVFAIFLAFNGVCQAAEWMVPGDCDTIQECIDLAASGDIVSVGPGTYPEAIDFTGKAITVRSLEGPETTIIDAQQSSNYVARFISGESEASLLQGFTLKNSSGSYEASGVYCDNSSPTIQGNIISDIVSTCSSFYEPLAAAIYSAGGAPVIIDNTISDITASCTDSNCTPHAFGIYIEGLPWTASSLLIEGNRINNITSVSPSLMFPPDSPGFGADGIYIQHYETADTIISGNSISGVSGYISSSGITTYCRSADITITKNTVINCVGGSALFGLFGGIGGMGNTVTIHNNLVANNRAATLVAGLGGRTAESSSISIQFNTVTNNLGGTGIWGYDSAGISAGGDYLTTIFTATIKNNIVTNNAGYGLYRLDEGGTFEVDHNDVWNNSLGGYNNIPQGVNDISADPIFLNPFFNVFHLQTTSPCIDQGTDTGITEDLDGEPRPQGDGFDMGAYEGGEEPQQPVWGPASVIDINNLPVSSTLNHLFMFLLPLGMMLLLKAVRR